MKKKRIILSAMAALAMAVSAPEATACFPYTLCRQRQPAHSRTLARLADTHTHKTYTYIRVVWKNKATRSQDQSLGNRATAQYMPSATMEASPKA